MAKKNEYLLIDGYNIIHAWQSLKKIADQSLEDARKKLLEMLSDYQGYKKTEIIIVFDAHLVKGNKESVSAYDKLSVVYTKEAETADSYIERTSKKLKKDFIVRVATSDHLEQIIILGQGAVRVSAKDLREEVVAAKKEMRAKYIDNKPIKNNLLLDNLDKETATLIEAMRLDRRS